MLPSSLSPQLRSVHPGELGGNGGPGLPWPPTYQAPGPRDAFAAMQSRLQEHELPGRHVVPLRNGASCPARVRGLARGRREAALEPSDR